MSVYCFEGSSTWTLWGEQTGGVYQRYDWRFLLHQIFEDKKVGRYVTDAFGGFFYMKLLRWTIRRGISVICLEDSSTWNLRGDKTGEVCQQYVQRILLQGSLWLKVWGQETEEVCHCYILGDSSTLTPWGQERYEAWQLEYYSFSYKF